MSRRARGTSFTSGRLARLAISPTSPLSTPPERPGQSPVRAPRASERERSGRSPQGNSDKPRMRVYRTSSTLTYNNQNAVAPVTNSFSMPSAVVQTLCVAMPHAAPKSCARVQAAHDRPSERPPPPPPLHICTATGRGSPSPFRRPPYQSSTPTLPPTRARYGVFSCAVRAALLLP